MRIDVKARREGGIVVASVLGRIDNASADEFRSLVEDSFGPEDDALVLDMEKVEFMSSAGLRACLILATNLGSERFAICALTELNREVVAISGFDQLIRVYTSQDGALRSLRAS